MKRKFISLILVLFLIPGAFMFVACKDKDGYKLSKLNSDFYSVAENTADNVDKLDNKIIFNYTKHEYSGKQIILEAMKTAPYNSLTDYNSVYENLMAFAFEYVDNCSNDTVDVNVQTKNQLQGELKALHTAIKDVNLCIDSFAEALKFNYNNDILNATCISRYKNLLNTYVVLYQKAINFTNTLEQIYFNNMVINSNPDISKMTVDFDKNIVINKLNSKIKYQISNLSKMFVEMYAGDFALTDSVANKTTTFNMSKFEFATNVAKLKDVIINEEVASEVVANDANKLDFYNAAVKAYNVQEILNNDNFMFIKASKDIDYTEVKLDAEKTDYETMCLAVIENYNNNVLEFSKVIDSMLQIINRGN